MNQTVPNAKNWPKQRIRKRGGLRAIDAGTLYDVAGNLRRLAREIDRGEMGRVTDIICATRSSDRGENGTQIRTFHWGKSNIETAHYMARVAVDRLEV